MAAQAYKSVPEGVISLLIKVDGEEIGYSSQVSSVSVYEAFAKIPSAEIVLSDGGLSEEDFVVVDSGLFTPGREIEIQLGYDGDLSTVFKGVIVRNSVRLDTGGSEIVVEARHPAFQMTMNRKTACFSDQTDAEAIQSIVQEYGIAATVEDTAVRHESLIQYNATDWDFVNLRAEAIGKLLLADSEGIRVFSPEVDKEAALTLDGSFSLYELEATVDARKAYPSYKAKAWNYTTQEVDEDTAETGAFDSEGGEWSSSALASGMKNGDYSLQMHSYQENPDAMSALMNAKLMRANLARIVGKATVPGYEAIHPGDVVRLMNAGKWVDGDNLVAAVRHTVSSGTWKTTVGFGLDDEPYSLKYDDIQTPPADGTLPPVYGLQAAKVEKLGEDPLGENRIQIRLLQGEQTALWARVALLDAGNERGTFFLPEVGDEVIVGFVNANPAEPVVLGVLHSGGAPAPVEANDDNHVKGIYTREKIKLVFDDEKKAVTLETPGGNALSISDDAKGISITDQNGNKITLDDQGITIESAKALQVKAQQDASLEGANVNVKANMSFKAEGQAGAEMSTSASAVIKGSIVQIN